MSSGTPWLPLLAVCATIAYGGNLIIFKWELLLESGIVT